MNKQMLILKAIQSGNCAIESKFTKKGWFCVARFPKECGTRPIEASSMSELNDKIKAREAELHILETMVTAGAKASVARGIKIMEAEQAKATMIRNRGNDSKFAIIGGYFGFGVFALCVCSLMALGVDGCRRTISGPSDSTPPVPTSVPATPGSITKGMLEESIKRVYGGRSG